MGNHEIDSFDVEPAVPSDGEPQALMSPYEHTCAYINCDWQEEHHHYEDSRHLGPKDSCSSIPCLVDRGQSVTIVETGVQRVEFYGSSITSGQTPDMAAIAAEQLLSSMETWSSTPEDHRAETPVRFVNMLRQMTTRDSGFKFTTFPAEGSDEMITLGPIPFYTLCAHHVVPFFGNAWIGYVPNELLVGLSKIPRTVRHLAKGFWVQETLTTSIADYLEKNLAPKGTAVVLKAEHMCMAMRGVEVAGVITTTSAMRGVFGDHTRTAKAEFMAGVNGRH